MRQVKNHKAIQARAKAREVLASPHTVRRILSRVADGDTLRAIADDLNVDYYAFHRLVTARHKEELTAARAAHAEAVVARNLSVADKIESGHLDPKSGSAAAGIRQWYAERAHPEQWGRQSNVSVTHKGSIGLHFEALQKFSDVPLGQEVVDGEFEEIEDEAPAEDEGPEAGEDFENHPLL